MEKVVLVLGAFDILHWGHVAFLREASNYGKVTVGLSGDLLLGLTKGTPIFEYAERKEALESLGFNVVMRGQRNARPLFATLRPEFFVCGNDWLEKDHLESAGLDTDFLNQVGCTVIYTSRAHSMSTAEIIRRVRD